MKIKQGNVGQGTYCGIWRVVSAQEIVGLIMLDVDDSPKGKKVREMGGF